MAHISFAERSREDWGKDESVNLSVEQIICGTLMRIADAQEKMQISICGLQRIAKLEAEVRSLKSTIRKLQKQNK